MSRETHDFMAWGLHVRSPIALPFIPVSAPAGGQPDVTVRFDTTPAELPTRAGKYNFWETSPGAFLLTIPDIARYLVRVGREILIEPLGGDDHDISIFLTGSVFAALLQQRGVTTLHASAIETDSGAVLFAGRSGIGKSSLLAALVERGCRMLADDVTGVVLDADNHPLALPAFPCTRLWADALDKLDWRGRAGERVRPDLSKYLAPVERFRATPLAVRGVYVLTSHDQQETAVEQVPPSDAFGWLSRYTYRKRYLHGLGQRPVHFRTITEMARRVAVARVRRPVHPFRLDELAQRIDEHLREGKLAGVAEGVESRRAGSPQAAEAASGGGRPPGPEGAPLPDTAFG